MSFQDIKSSKTAFRLLIAASYIACLIVIGTIMFSLVEGLTYGNSFYFTVQTLFSIGYGDVCPVTDMGKILTTLFIIFGITGFLASVSIVGTWILKKYSHRNRTLNALKKAGERRRQDALYKWADKNNVQREIIDDIIKKTMMEEDEK
jgi:voltage-gated potassium channel